MRAYRNNREERLKSTTVRRLRHYILNTPGLVTDRMLRRVVSERDETTRTYMSTVRSMIPAEVRIDRVRGIGYVIRPN